jgi:hypothetical protein
MPEPESRFRTREEYEAWKASAASGDAPPASAESIATSARTSAARHEATTTAIAGFRIAAGLNLLAALLIFIQSKSAVHEIEALMCVLIAAVFSVGSTIATGLNRLSSSLR